MFEPLARGRGPLRRSARRARRRRDGDGRRRRRPARDRRRRAAARSSRISKRRCVPTARSRGSTKMLDDDGDESGPKAAHAAVGGEGAELVDEELSPTSSTASATSRLMPARRWRPRTSIAEGTFQTNWVYQAYLEPHAATAWTEPDGTLSVVAATQGIFYVRKQLAKIYGRPISKVRVQATPLGGSFGSKILIVEPLVAGAALALGRPVRLVLNRREDMAATNPASGLDHRRPDRRDGGRDADRPRCPAGVRRRGVHGVGDRRHRGGPRRRAVPLGGVRRPRVRRPDEPVRDRLLSRSGRAAGGLRHRVADRRARREAGDRPDRAPPPQPRRPRRTTWSTANRGRASGIGRSSRPSRRIRCGEGAPTLPADEGVAVAHGRLAGRQGARGRALPVQRRRDAHGRDRRRRHERDDVGVRRDRRRDVRRVGRRRRRRQPRYGRRATVAAERRQRRHLLGRTGGPRGRGRRAPAAARLRRDRDGDRSGGPRDRRRRRPAGGLARPGPVAGGARRGAPRLRQRPPADRGPRLDRPEEPRARRPRRTSRTSAWTARPARSPSSASPSRRTSGGRSTRRWSRARCVAARRRASAGRSTRR